MGNLLTYLWETMGDQWEQRAWNAVDSLILSQFAYLPLEEVCTEAFDFSKGMPLGEAAAVMLALPDIKEKILTRRDLLLLRMLSESERFRNLRVCGCRKRHQTAEPEQFAAYCVELTQEPPCWFAAFRGTDRTLTGWEEDLQLSYLETTPTQEDAVQYLEQAAAALPGTFLVGGHSKGGNAAVYAAVFCSVSVQNRIQAVYNHDGPGFQPSVLASPRYANVEDRIQTIVPQGSFVGQLLTHLEPCMIVKSNAVGVMQHAAYSWEVKDGAFVTVSELSNSSVLASQIMASWLEQLSAQQREALTKQLFAIPDRAGMADALTVQTVQKALPNIFLQWKSLPQEERELLQGAWTHLSDVAKQELKKACSSHLPFFQEE